MKSVWWMWVDCAESQTLTMTLLCATGMSSNVFTLRGRLHLSLCWDVLHRGEKRLNDIHCRVFLFLDIKAESKIIMLTQRTVGCHSGAELPGFPRFGVGCRGSWGQGSMGSLLPQHLLSKGCSPSHPVDQDMISPPIHTGSLCSTRKS